MEKEQILLEWEAFEYLDKKRKPDWFWALGIIAVAGSAVAFIYGNFLFGIFIVLTAAAMIYFGTTKPQKIKHAITTEGVLFDGRMYPYERLKSFWMEELGGEKRLIIKSDKTFMPIMVIPLKKMRLEK
ncbi:MAG: hypothetical protein R3B65_00575 [Candidatus Paceibacterota bacterium]